MARVPGHLTRRTAAGLVLGGPMALWFGWPTRAGAEGWAARLVRSFDKMPLGIQPSRLELVQFSTEAQDRGVLMQAVVRLTWPPGMRQRGFKILSSDPELALAILTSLIDAYFVGVTAKS